VWYGLGCHSELCGLERLRALAYASVAYSLDKINGPGLDGMWYGHGWMLAWTGLDWTGLDMVGCMVWTWMVCLLWLGHGHEWLLTPPLLQTQTQLMRSIPTASSSSS
jgi:hypothetical protein